MMTRLSFACLSHTRVCVGRHGLISFVLGNIIDDHGTLDNPSRITQGSFHSKGPDILIPSQACWLQLVGSDKPFHPTDTHAGIVDES